MQQEHLFEFNKYATEDIRNFIKNKNGCDENRLMPEHRLVINFIKKSQQIFGDPQDPKNRESDSIIIPGIGKFLTDFIMNRYYFETNKFETHKMQAVKESVFDTCQRFGIDIDFLHAYLAWKVDEYYQSRDIEFESISSKPKLVPNNFVLKIAREARSHINF